MAFKELEVREIDRLEIDENYAELLVYEGGNVIGNMDKYQINYNIKGRGRGQLNFPRTLEKWVEVRELYMELFNDIINQAQFTIK